MKWEIIILIGFGILMLVGGYFIVKQDVIDIKSNQLEGKSYTAKGLNNSFTTRNGTSKTFLANESRVLIRNASTNETFLDLKLLSQETEWGIIAGVDQKVAEFWVSNYKNTSQVFFDIVNAYDKSNKSVSKVFKLKYGIDTLFCPRNTEYCDNQTTWIEFKNLSELPKNNIRVGLFTNTIPFERIEWIPSIKGMNVTEWAVWNVSTASYNNVNFSVSTQTNFPNDLFFSENGSSFYIVERTGDTIYQYNMTQLWNVSTAVYSGFSFNISAQGGEPRGLFINSTGTRMYMVDQTANRVFSYTLAQPWNVSSATYDNVNFSVSQDAGANQVFFNLTGEKMYVLSITGDRIYQYTLSNPWNVSSATYDNVNFSIATQEGTTGGLYIRPDGLKWYIIGTAADRVFQYNMSQAWNLSTASYENINFSTVNQDATGVGLFFNKTGTRMYTIGAQNQRVYEYDISDTQAPNWSNPMVNNTSPAILDTVLFSVLWNENVNLNTTIFSINDSGVGCDTFVNTTPAGLTGNLNWSNFSHQIPGTCLLANEPKIAWRVYTNDSSGNLNVSALTFSFVVASNCWSYTDATNTLYVPSGCTYYQTGSGYIG